MSFHHLITPDMLDLLCPMHCRISSTGHVTHIGPTLRKLGSAFEAGTPRFLEVFRVMRPVGIQTMQDLQAVSGRKLHLELRAAPRTPLKGLVVAAGPTGEMVVNLSFGISIMDAVRHFDLIAADFAPTDLTIEMLYLIEAKSAAMAASHKLNKRLQGAKLAAEEQAFTDTLTGLKNRRALDTMLSRMVEAGQPLSVMHMDLDFFKAVNDSYGHAAGDHVLLVVAQALDDSLRECDIATRVGGDEFIILVPDCTDRKTLKKIGRRLIDALEKPIPFQGHICKISGSIGTVTWNGKTSVSPESLIDDADIALYSSKHAGRGRQTFYSPKLREYAQSFEVPKGRTVELW